MKTRLFSVGTPIVVGGFFCLFLSLGAVLFKRKKHAKSDDRFFWDVSKISFPFGNYHVTFNEDDNVVRLIN
jgi:hypothetical protein